MLQELNDTNNASSKTMLAYTNCLLTFYNEHLYGAEFGVAYGGGIEKIGKIWGNRGTVWGFDTFEGHPKQISKVCPYTKQIEDKTGKEAPATYCMDNWYNSEEYGLEKTQYNYIRSKLDEQNLNNVILIKGIVDENTNVDFIPKLHYALIDLDFPISQLNAWNLIKHKFVKGAYLCLHDMIPETHLFGNYEIYQKIISENLFDIVYENNSEYLCILRKK